MADKDLITPADLCTLDFDLTDIYAERQTWQDGVLFRRERPRKSTGILFLNGCRGVYSTAGQDSFTAHVKSLVCLPCRSEYAVLNLTSGQDTPDAYLVECNIVQNGRILTFSQAPFLIPEMNPYYVGDLMRRIVIEYENLCPSPARLKADIYTLLAYLAKEARNGQAAQRSSIRPAVDHLERNPTAQVTVEELAEMCHMSAGCFRRLFAAQVGKSPRRYINDRKIDMAKKMLENSNTPVARIAELLEFDSSSYFCRLFKQKTGLTPGDYRKS